MEGSLFCAVAPLSLLLPEFSRKVSCLRRPSPVLLRPPRVPGGREGLRPGCCRRRAPPASFSRGKLRGINSVARTKSGGERARAPRPPHLLPLSHPFYRASSPRRVFKGRLVEARPRRYITRNWFPSRSPSPLAPSTALLLLPPENFPVVSFPSFPRVVLKWWPSRSQISQIGNR